MTDIQADPGAAREPDHFPDRLHQTVPFAADMRAQQPVTQGDRAQQRIVFRWSRVAFRAVHDTQRCAAGAGLHRLVHKGYGLFQLPLRKRLGGKALYRAAHRPDAGKKAQMERQLCLLQRTHIARITIIAYMRRYLSHYRLDIFIKLPVPAYIQRYRS